MLIKVSHFEFQQELWVLSVTWKSSLSDPGDAR